MREPEPLQRDRALDQLLCPVEDREDALARRFVEIEDAGLGRRAVGHEVDGHGGSAETHHVDEVGVLDERDAFGRVLKRGQVVADFEHASGNRGERDGGPRFIERQRLAASCQV